LLIKKTSCRHVNIISIGYCKVQFRAKFRPEREWPSASVLQPCLATFASITNPTPTQLFVFIDENEVTLEDPQFGYPQPGSGWPYEWWDMPSNRHRQGSNLSFADGHAEHWRWQAPMTATSPPGYAQPVPGPQLPDYTRVGNAMRQKDFDGQAN
jgi:prepilin-type processing-associated H-X9-DG protein